MAVYTDVTDEELQQFLAGYDLGALMSYKGIAEGVENSNFLLQTSKGAFILTLYEKRVRLEDLPFFIGLMQHLTYIFKTGYLRPPRPEALHATRPAPHGGDPGR